MEGLGDDMVELTLGNVSSLAERTFHVLADAIVSGKIPLGSRLRESELAEKLSVSRSPLREAISRLESAGLVRTISRKGSYVVKPTSGEISNLFQVREYLEGLAARLAAGRMTAEQLEQLERNLRHVRARLESEATGYPEESPDFHAAIASATLNDTLVETLRRIHRQSGLVRRLSGARSARAVVALQDHEEILEALRGRDADCAEKRMRQHIRSALTSILEALDGGSDDAN
jgi:DNA-binding GntR family transcriptional regulator